MKKKIVVLLLIIIVKGAFAQTQEDFKPNGKVIGQAIARFESDITNSNHVFNFDRIRFGYEYNFLENIQGKILLEARESGSYNTQYATFVKLAELSYNIKDWNLRISGGLVANKTVDAQEAAWGHRVVMKTFMDENGFVFSSDYGLFLNYKHKDLFTIEAGIFNGEGQNYVKRDSTFKYAIATNITPIKGLTIRAYFDNSFLTGAGKDNSKKSNTFESQITVGSMIAYKYEDKFNIGLEYALQDNSANIKEQNIDGFSVFGTYFINSKYEVFARYDKLNSQNSYTKGMAIAGDKFIVGVQFNPAKNVRIAPSYKLYNPKIEGLDNISYFALNFGFDLK